MRKLFVLLFAITIAGASFSQENKSLKKFNVKDQAGDHIMLQLSSDRWLQAPDSIDSRRKGMSRGAGIYIMLNKPFANNPKFSVAFGLGLGSSSIFFDKMNVDISGSSSDLLFEKLDTTNRFKKYKVVTNYLEIPVEFRFTSKPSNPKKAFKFAIGAKVGTLLNAHTKAKNEQNSSGTAINDYTQKISSKKYFNTTRIVGTARIGFGYFSLFGAYNITPVFKDGVATEMKLLQVGLTISGL